MLLRLTAQFLKYRCKAVLSISGIIGKQLDELTGKRSPKVVLFRPIYEHALFSSISRPDWVQSPFRVIFVGRVTVEKGVFTLLDAARLLRQRSCENIVFEICGTGGAFNKLQQSLRQEKITDVNLHGHCDRARLSKLYSQCHVVIVPTTRDFPEGFNRVSIEAILCARPAIVSSAALEPDIASAAIEVQPADPEGLADAIVKLKENRVLYEQLCLNAVGLQESFYDKRRGWEQGLKTILAMED